MRLSDRAIGELLFFSKTRCTETDLLRGFVYSGICVAAAQAARAAVAASGCGSRAKTHRLCTRRLQVTASWR
jgi:hypothetical protein